MTAEPVSADPAEAVAACGSCYETCFIMGWGGVGSTGVGQEVDSSLMLGRRRDAW